LKVVAQAGYGPPQVLHVEERPAPAPAGNEVLVRVRAASVTKFDCWQRSCTAPLGFGLLARFANGLLRPRQPVLGTDLAGAVEAVGPGVTRFSPGDAVWAYTGAGLGAWVEYRCFPEDGMIAGKPGNLSFEEAGSCLQGFLTALFFLRKGGTGPGRRVLVYGASGGVGMAAVQLARHMGAEVTGVCSAGKADLVRSLGAAEVLDYRRDDLFGDGSVYDVVLDTVGRAPMLRIRRALKPGGVYLITTFSLPRLFQALWLRLARGRTIGLGMLRETPDDLALLGQLFESGAIRPVLDRTFTIEEAPDAGRYVESGGKAGSVALVMKMGE